MPLNPQGTVYLTDAQRRFLGQVFIERTEGDRVFGRFAPQADFAAVRSLFEELEEAANGQMFSEADRLAEQIDRLGLHLAGYGAEQLAICDVQIMGESTLCCRVPNLALTQLPRAVA
jgi:hypothetical protein